MQIEQQLAAAKCTHPFSYLGPTLLPEGVSINAWLPGATAVTVTNLSGDTIFGTLPQQDDTAYFSGVVEQLAEGQLYAFEVTTATGNYRTVDPYQFKEPAYHAVHFIDHAPQNLYRQAGAQLITLNEGVSATRFTVYAPNASAVSLIGDFNMWNETSHPMQKTDLGFWVLIVPGVSEGMRYKYAIKDAHGHALPHKADPLGYHADQYPSHASLVYDHGNYEWQDQAWMEYRKHDKYSAPMIIYEVHLGSWKRPGEEDKRYLSYADLVDDLIPYVKEMGYTHIELLPISEFPFDGSWGYQPVGMFSPTSRFGDPDAFKAFVDACHREMIGVIIDWVPAHFPEDGHGLARFDGSHVYEYEDPRKGWHNDWNSCIYDFGKDTVRQFLVANALFWLDKYHVDGLRVDAVASMLYLDYSRNDGEWIPNVDGGNENYEAISLLKWMNEEVYRHFPDAMTIAEESTSFPQVSRPVFEGGLGFGFKWNMGWMHDSLHYISKDPAYRNYHHGDITFSMVYAFTENFVLPISHDEVVHGKGSLIGKMPGDEWQQAANHRCYAGFMYGHPGKKLNFMGNELGQAKEWNHDSSLDWDVLAYDKHRGIQAVYRDLNRLYKSFPALHELDSQEAGFEWIDHENAEQSVLSFVRKSADNTQKVYVVSNFTPVPREDFRLGVLDEGEYEVIFNSDAGVYWGSDHAVPTSMHAEPHSWNHKPHSISVSLPPLATLFIVLK